MVILFDLDGTLLPMDQEIFTNAYFKKLSEYFAPYGYEPQELINGVWHGTKAMIRNNGRATNEAAFWETFASDFGEKASEEKERFLTFYETEFDGLKTLCGFDPSAKKTVQLLKENGYTLALASNPVFPLSAQIKRLKWAGLDENDFIYITSYENSHYCKPNPLYYQEIAEKLRVHLSDCIMVGNDTTEDMEAGIVGMKVFLLTNCLQNKERKDISKFPRGNFRQLLNFVNLNLGDI